jgi:MGT family glycosyltransferase
VYVTLGTVASTRTEVLRAAVEGAASLDVDVLVASGPGTDPRDIGPMPAHVQVRPWVDQEAVLARAAIAVHHGGAGTLCACGAAAVPQVILPQMADQFINAASIAEHGVGASLVGESATPAGVAAAITALLGDEAVRQDAQALRDEIASMPSPDEVAQRLLKL